MESYYANLIAYRVTPTELVLEFGNFFTGQEENRTEASFKDFDIRIVMNPDLIEALLQFLDQAKVARDAQREAMGAWRAEVAREEKSG